MTTQGGRRLEFPTPPRRRSPRSAWPAFEKRLAGTLAALEEDQYLVVSAKRGWAYVQFAAQGSYGLRAECMSNNYLDEAHALSAGQVARLRKIGWSAPTGTLDEIRATRRTDGSPNFFRDFDRPVPCADAARMAVRALTEVFDIRHPELRKLVLKAIGDGSGKADLELDEDGDIALRFGSAAVFVRVLDAPPCVRMFSPVLETVEENARLLDRLNGLNADFFFARFFVVEGRVIVAVETSVAPFVAEHVSRVCLQLGSLADRIGGELQEEFGGRRAFDEEPEGAGVQ